MSRSDKLLIAVYATVAILFVPVYPHFVSPGEFSRWLTVSAVVEERTLEVSQRLALIGGHIEDLSEFRGKIYSNKAPGAALVSLPGYVIARIFVSPTDFRFVLTAMRLSASTIPLLLMAVAFTRLGRRWGSDPAAIRVALVTLLFATPVFAYSLLLFSHVLSAAALFGGWFLLFSTKRSAARDLAAGALLGLAAFVEYPAVVPAAALALTACRLDIRRLLLTTFGGVPFLLLLGVYNQLCFGSPFELSSGHERLAAFRSLAGSGMFGVGVPSPVTAARLLLSTERGLFFFSPVLLLGAIALFRQRREPAALAALLATASILVFYSGYPNWHGGWTVGARYLIPAMPLLATGLLRRKASPLSDLLLMYSVTAVMLTTISFPFVPEDFRAPWGSFALPTLFRSLAVMDLLRMTGVVTVMLALAYLAATARWRTAALAGALTSLVVGLIAMYGSTPRNLLERAYITEVYLGREGELERVGAPPQLLERAARERTLPPEPLAR